MRRPARRPAALPGLLLGLLLALLAAPLAAQPADLGEVDFPTSTADAAAQGAFERGVALLHSFEYADARDAFREAQAADPGFAMAYWGEAMTHNHPLWREQDRDAAREALGRLAPTAEERRAKTPTPRERGYLAAVETLFGEGDKVARDHAYARAMAALAAAHPGDLEAKAFRALAVLGTAQGERDFGVYMEAAALAEEVFAARPRHPGAAHYLIHSYDDPVHAPLGLRPARVYAEIAPAASHAQHMISHIYIALGAWQEAATANERSVAVSEERARTKSLPLARARNHHALHWLEYAYLQQGRAAEAWETVTTADADAAAEPGTRGRWYQAYMRATYGAESGDWARAADVALDLEDLDVGAVAARLFTVGMAALQRDDAAGLAAALAELAARRRAVEEAADDDPLSRHSPAARQAAAVVELELRALAEGAAGRATEMVRLLGEAAAAESAMALDYGPPTVVRPSHELLGEVLLAAGKPTEAQAAYTVALARAPRRAIALTGRRDAAHAAGDTATAERAEAELAEIRAAAEPVETAASSR